MKEWFEQLAPRERTLVMIAGAIGVFALIVLLGIRPIISASKRGHDAVEDKRALLSELHDVAARIGPQSGTGQSVANGSSQSLVLIVDQTTRSNGLAQYLKRNQPDGATSIRLRFEGAPFDEMIAWLSGVQSQHGLSVSTANIDAASGKGRVNCNLTLARQGA